MFALAVCSNFLAALEADLDGQVLEMIYICLARRISKHGTTSLLGALNHSGTVFCMGVFVRPCKGYPGIALFKALVETCRNLEIALEKDSSSRCRRKAGGTILQLAAFCNILLAWSFLAIKWVYYGLLELELLDTAAIWGHGLFCQHKAWGVESWADCCMCVPHSFTCDFLNLG